MYAREVDTKEAMFTDTESTSSIVHISISDMVAEKLRDGIMNGTFRSNQKLVEADLCRKMEVSRTPIRKAFSILEEEGLIERIQGYGVVVAIKDIETKYYWDILIALERVALEKAIDKIANENLNEMRAVQYKLEEILKNKKQSPIEESDEWEAIAELDHKFHDIIVKKSGNPLLSEYIDVICKRGNILRFMKTVNEESIEEHRSLIHAMEEKNLVKADNLIKIHFERENT